MASKWLQNRSKMPPRGVLEPSWEPLGHRRPYFVLIFASRGPLGARDFRFFLLILLCVLLFSVYHHVVSSRFPLLVLVSCVWRLILAAGV